MYMYITKYPKDSKDPHTQTLTHPYPDSHTPNRKNPILPYTDSHISMPRHDTHAKHSNFHTQTPILPHHTLIETVPHSHTHVPCSHTQSPMFHTPILRVPYFTLPYSESHIPHSHTQSPIFHTPILRVPYSTLPYPHTHTPIPLPYSTLPYLSHTPILHTPIPLPYSYTPHSHTSPILLSSTLPYLILVVYLEYGSVAGQFVDDLLSLLQQTAPSNAALLLVKLRRHCLR